ncbi:hypothetical protein ACFQ60_47230 [Streptomyces zhihengii]
MTTQQPSRALAREAAGLLMTATGAFGALVALGALHWALGAATASGPPSPSSASPTSRAPALLAGRCACGQRSASATGS